jgi:hypothetical protein
VKPWIDNGILFFLGIKQYQARPVRMEQAFKSILEITA